MIKTFLPLLLLAVFGAADPPEAAFRSLSSTFQRSLLPVFLSSVSFDDSNTFNDDNKVLAPPLSLRRFLAAGDFDRFNKLFEGARIALPDSEIKQWILFADLIIKIKNLYCTDLTVEDILLTYEKESNQKLSFTVSVQGLDMNCYGDYDYAYGAIKGSGSIAATTDSNTLETKIALTSTDFDVEPPSEAVVEYCEARVDVTNLDFSGGVVASIADLFQGLIAGRVESEVNGGTYGWFRFCMVAAVFSR